MSHVVSSTGRHSWGIGAFHRKAVRHIALAMCALYLVMGGAVVSVSMGSGSVFPPASSLLGAGRAVPAAEHRVVLRSGVFIPNDADGGPPIP
jgi:hypothetical protein